MRIERISDVQSFAGLREQWNDLRSGPGSSSPALTHEWFSAWLEAFGKGTDLAILVLFEDDAASTGGNKLLGAAPMQIVRSTYRGIRCSQLRFLYNRHGPRCAFLMRDGHGGQTGLLMDAALGLTGWDVAILENIPHDSYLYALCAGLSGTPGRSTLLRKTMSSPFLRVNGSWDSFFDSRPRNLKRSLRSKEKKLAKAGEIKIEHLTEAAASVAVMPALIAIGEKSWKAKGGRAIGSQPESRRFYSLLAEAFGSRGEVSVWLMRINGEPAAFEFHLARDKQVQALRAEFDEKYRDLGVGSILDMEIVKWLFDSVYNEYDMGGESDFYKLRWTEETRSHSELLVFNRSLAGRLLGAIEKRLVEPAKRLTNGRTGRS